MYYVSCPNATKTRMVEYRLYITVSVWLKEIKAMYGKGTR